MEEFTRLIIHTYILLYYQLRISPSNLLYLSWEKTPRESALSISMNESAWLASSSVSNFFHRRLRQRESENRRWGNRSRNNEHVSAHDTLNEINAAWTLASVQIASHGVFSKRRIISSLSILPKRNHHLQKLCCIALFRDLYNVENDCAIIEIIGARPHQLPRELRSHPLKMIV